MKEKKKKELYRPCRRDEELRVHGLLQAVLLLSVGEEPRHGYELFKVLSDQMPASFIPDLAVVYRILRNLEKESYVSSCLKSGGGGPARKVYALTPEGADYLAERYETVQSRVKALNQFLERYEERADHLQIRRLP
jgi:PadR family transcriptional regulator, regulatory protein PadR